MRRIFKHITKRDIELVWINIVQEHVDATKVISCNINLLTKETVTDVIFAKNLGKF